MKITCLIIAVILFSPLPHAAVADDLPAQVQNRIDSQVREMKAVGVPADAARHMLTMMHRNRFSDESIKRACQAVINSAKAGLPAAPLMSKAAEGMAKKVGERKVIAAMEAVRSRYAYANRLAGTLSRENKQIKAMTRTIADTLAAGMTTRDMDTVMAQLQVQARAQAGNRTANAQLASQTLQTARTMARLGMQSGEVADALCRSLRAGYTHQEMKRLRNEFAKTARQASSRQAAGSHAGSIGNGGHSGGSGPGGGGPGGGGPGGGGPGGGGPGGGGPGGGGPGGGGHGGGGPGGGGHR